MTTNPFSRIPEPELMEAADQVEAYALADFAESHDRVIQRVAESFPGCRFAGPVLNLGCGPGDDLFRFLKRFPESSVVGIDGSGAMIARAKAELAGRQSRYAARVEFHVAYIPSESIPRRSYVAVVSNSLLHHFHDPDQFWNCVREFAKPGVAIFVADLRRPASMTEVEQLVAVHAKGAPEVLRQDYRNSLRAAFTIGEVREQLDRARLAALSVSELGDRHLVVSGWGADS